jgi:iron-sulfur cluster repair protein YtfE (RIC family)
MKRFNNLIPLSHDHHHGLILANLIKRNAPPYKGLPNDTSGKATYAKQFFADELVRHFKEEEEILYPLVKGRNNNIDKIFLEIFDEHKQIKNLVEQLDTNPDTENILDKLGNLLDAHIRKEERNLFVLIQEEFKDSELELMSKHSSQDN